MNIATSEKILDASVALFSEKGYKGVTTREIAKEAGVSEMTVFRHFDSKRNLFEKAFERFVFSPKFRAVFQHNLEWDLEKDLYKISCSYQDTLMKYQKIILMQFKNGELTFSTKSPLYKFPSELKILMVNYLSAMRDRGKVKEDPEVLALSFMAANFGFFMTYTVHQDLTGDTNINSCIRKFVKFFAKGAVSTGTVTERATKN